jgi:hypothetical protein
VTSAKPISVTTMSTGRVVSKFFLLKRLEEIWLTIVLGLVDVGAHGDDAGDTGRVGLRRAGRRSVHDGVLGVTQEIGRATETVKHTAAHYASAVGVCVDIDLDGSVHADDAQSLDNLRGVRDGLRAEKELRSVAVVVVVETLEALRTEADRCSSGEVEIAAVEEIEEAVLEHLSPDLEVLEVGAARSQAADNCVSNVANTGLDGSEVCGKTAVLDLVLEELDKVAGDLAAGLVLSGVGLGLVHVVGLDDGNNLLGVDRDVGKTDAVLRRHDKVGLLVRRNVGTNNVVETSKIGRSSVDLDDDLLSHLDDLRAGANGSTRDDATFRSNGRGLDNSYVELLVLLVLGVVSVDQVRGTHGKVLVEELDVAVVDALCDILADLMRTSPLDHVVACPSVLSLCARRGADKKVVLQLTLEAVLLDVVGQCGGNHLRVAHTGETTPSL